MFKKITCLLDEDHIKFLKYYLFIFHNKPLLERSEMQICPSNDLTITMETTSTVAILLL